jgi:tetrahydromethanopterin S-methyltransferase subunit B
MFYEVWSSSGGRRERFMANSPTIDELSREELIVIVHEQQLQIEVLAKLFEQLKRKKSPSRIPSSLAARREKVLSIGGKYRPRNPI